MLKVTGKGTKKGRSVVVTPIGKKGKSVYVSGNIPELYQGMFIELELDDSNRVLEYNLVLSNKNIQALEKAGINPEEYRVILERHQILKQDGIGWNSAKISLDELYDALPFGEADKVHKEMVDNASEPTRVEAISKKIISNARNRRKIAYKVEEYLGYFDEVEQEGAYQQLMVTLKMLCLQATRYGVKGGVIWDAEMKSKEDYIRENIEQRKSVEYQLLTDWEISSFLKTVQNRGLEKEQLDTLWCLSTSSPCVITGGAGVGKTTVIQTLIDCYAMHYSRNNVLLIAPTGKASRRLAEKTKMPASTIHKALRKNPEDDYTYYGEDNPLPYRLIIVDESSMIDTALMYDLLSAVDPTSKVVFVGDHNQLYPVGYGEPFFEFLEKLEVYRLTINHRQQEGTDILLNAERILADEEIYSGAGVIVDHIGYDDIGDIVLTNNEDTQIISPYNALNATINAFLRKGEADFNVGDKVITIVNTKEYCNGDIGEITSIDEKGNITVDIEGRSVIITKGKYEDLMLAYALTVHKMQGSEAKRVVVFIPENDKMVEKRMLYTAVTRARSELEVYFFQPEE